MTFKQRLQKLQSRFNKQPVWQGDKKVTVIPAFALDGIQYYEIPGVFNMPYARAMAARDALMEVDARITKEYLINHIEQVKKILSDAKSINILELSKLYTELDQRTRWIASPDTIYKLASIVYFDQQESPYEYNGQYCADKIAKWKKYGVDAFFLQEPIKKFIPYSELLEKGIWKSEKDMLDYIETAIRMETIQKKAVS